MRYSQILVENRRFNLSHLYLAPPSGVTPLEFRRDLWHQKTRRIALSCGIKNIAGRFFGLVTKHACDRQTDGQNYDSQDRASIAASRGKNETLVYWSILRQISTDFESSFTGRFSRKLFMYILLGLPFHVNALLHCLAQFLKFITGPNSRTLLPSKLLQFAEITGLSNRCCNFLQIL